MDESASELPAASEDTVKSDEQRDGQQTPPGKRWRW
jgi:hypothetical protein